MCHFRRTVIAVLAFGMISSARADVQQEFFKAVQSGKVKELTRLMRPELLEEIDEPVLDDRDQ